MYKLHYDNFLINEHDDDDDDVYGAEATRSTFNKVDCVEFNFVASVYRALAYVRTSLPKNIIRAMKCFAR